MTIFYLIPCGLTSILISLLAELDLELLLDELFPDFDFEDFEVFGVGSVEFPLVGVGFPLDSTLLTIASGVFTC